MINLESQIHVWSSPNDQPRITNSRLVRHILSIIRIIITSQFYSSLVFSTRLAATATATATVYPQQQLQVQQQAPQPQPHDHDIVNILFVSFVDTSVLTSLSLVLYIRFNVQKQNSIVSRCRLFGFYYHGHGHL
jgi:hypothetical protein